MLLTSFPWFTVSLCCLSKEFNSAKLLFTDKYVDIYIYIAKLYLDTLLFYTVYTIHVSDGECLITPSLRN